jgi:hypothetical protein
VPEIGVRLAGRDGVFAMRFGGSHGADDTPGGYPGQTAGAGAISTADRNPFGQAIHTPWLGESLD